VEWIRDDRDYRRVYSRGKRFVSRDLVLHVCAGRRGGTRFGISVSKKVGKAVTRNRVKRRLREICMQVAGRIDDGYDCVISARRGAGSAGFQDLSGEVEHLLRQAGKVRDD